MAAASIRPGTFNMAAQCLTAVHMFGPKLTCGLTIIHVAEIRRAVTGAVSCIVGDDHLTPDFVPFIIGVL